MQHCSPPVAGATVNGESRVGVAMGSSSSPSDGVSRSGMIGMNPGMRSTGAGGSGATQSARHEHPDGAKSLQKPTHDAEGAVGEAVGRGVARVGDLVGATVGDLVGVDGASVGRAGAGAAGASVGAPRALRRCLGAARAGCTASAAPARAAAASVVARALMMAEGRRGRPMAAVSLD